MGNNTGADRVSQKKPPNSIKLLLLYDLVLILVPIVFSLVKDAIGSPELIYYSVFTPIAIGAFTFLVQCLFCGFIKVVSISRKTIIGYMLYLIIPLVLFNTVSYHGSFALLDLATGKDRSALNIGFHTTVIFTFIIFKIFLID